GIGFKLTRKGAQHKSLKLDVGRLNCCPARSVLFVEFRPDLVGNIGIRPYVLDVIRARNDVTNVALSGMPKLRLDPHRPSTDRRTAIIVGPVKIAGRRASYHAAQS
ncbi:MAG TPA: hypothetical protein H9902_12110, partial [Candidatus Stackebrandtia faecavium]|nr:hypothetical protein [Candidatus Stackebrandtia faecavium]